MAVLFSAVTVTSDSDQAEFLVAGVPKSYADLEGWTAFESFMNEVDTEQDIKVHVAACLYGEGEQFIATPEEVAYFTMRAAETDDFFYSPCVPDLITAMGNEINAVIIQTVLCGLLGSGFSVSSVIWEIEDWSIVKQTGIYFLIISVIMLPIAYFMYWMEHSVTGFLSYFGIFILIFAVIWIVQFIIGKKNIKRMNEKLSETRKTDSNN